MKVTHNALRVLRQHRRVFVGHFALFELGSDRHTPAHLLFQISVKPLFGIELRAVAGQLKKLDLIVPFGHA